MKKTIASMASMVALFASSVAHGQEATVPSASTPPPATTTTTAAPAPATTPPISPVAAPDPAVTPVVPVQPAAPTSTTTVTNADTTTAPPAIPVDRPSETLYTTTRPNRALLYTGGAIFVASYVTTAAITGARMSDAPGADKALYIPIVGPWLHLADAKEGTTDSLLIGGSGVLQGVGAGLAIASVFIPEKIPTATITAGNVKMNVAPTSFGERSAGMGAIGTF